MRAHAPAPRVSARIGALIVQVAAVRGVDAKALMTEAGFDPAWLHDAEARMPLAVEECLWNGAAARTGDPLFGLRAAQSLRPGAFDVLDYAVRTAPDLRSALQRLVRYNRLVHDLATFDLVPRGETLRVEHRFDGATRPCRQAAEFTLASIVVVASQIGGEPVQALAVEFAHAAPEGGVEPFRQVFGVPPRFGAPVSCVVLAREVVDRPVPAADPGLSRIVMAHAEQLLAALAAARPAKDERIAAQVSRQLAEGMAHGPMTLGQVAQRLHLSERSLQRRLDAEGTRFADLLDEVRRELALRYIADERLALGEVAYLLGFAEPSPFHRAFKRWTGKTPAAARRGLH
ncbi:MAG: AraC family transcriptional regulator [Rubrivivax sp.]|nr:AraC family transcriptional regulator [Rubrivivax sp.]